MRLIRSPNRWSCLPTSFAMVLDVDLEFIIRAVGHDGSEVIWPDLPDPCRRRGFHIQEMVYLAWSLGWTATPHEALPVSQGRADAEPYPVPMRLGPDVRLKCVMQDCAGVVVGETPRGAAHAVAWDGSGCLDPGGESCDLDNFNIECFWAIKSSLKIVRNSLEFCREV